jgi:DNA (cytosine-5)-methyltransferase 1
MDGYWLNEPDIPRTAKGIKNRVARLKALGNSVVPAQVYPIFRAIVEIEGGNLWNFGNCNR